jgi:hypothetical protein
MIRDNSTAKSEEVSTELATPKLRLLRKSVAHPRGSLPRRSSDDATLHRESRPRFCPACGTSYEGIATNAGIVVEFWTAHARVFHCWCAACGEAVDIAEANQVITDEIEH